MRTRQTGKDAAPWQRADSWICCGEVDEQVARDSTVIAIVCGLAIVTAALHEAIEQLLCPRGLWWSGDGVGGAPIKGDLWTETDGIFGKSLPRSVRLGEVSALQRDLQLQCVQDIKLVEVAWTHGRLSEPRPNEDVGLLEFAQLEQLLRQPVLAGTVLRSACEALEGIGMIALGVLHQPQRAMAAACCGFAEGSSGMPLWMTRLPLDRPPYWTSEPRPAPSSATPRSAPSVWHDQTHRSPTQCQRRGRPCPASPSVQRRRDASATRNVASRLPRRAAAPARAPRHSSGCMRRSADPVPLPGSGGMARSRATAGEQQCWRPAPPERSQRKATGPHLSVSRSRAGQQARLAGPLASDSHRPRRSSFGRPIPSRQCLTPARHDPRRSPSSRRRILSPRLARAVTARPPKLRSSRVRALPARFEAAMRAHEGP
jgi:hypothetical protein